MPLTVQRSRRYLMNPMIERQKAAPVDPRIRRVLLDCVSGHDRQGLASMLESPDFNWTNLWALAEEHHVTPLVAHMLEHQNFAAVSAEAKRTARNIRVGTLLYNMAVQAELERVGQLLNSATIPATPLKGTQLSKRIFGEVSARRCGDIDLLVPEVQHEHARSLLIDAGYSPIGDVRPGVARHAFHGVPLVRQASGLAFVIELHWGLSDPRFVTIDAEQLWQRVGAWSGSECGLRPLPPEELLVFLAIHLPKHDVGVLRLVADIHHLILSEGDSIEWPHVVDLAEHWHADDMLYFGLSLATQLLDTPLPDDLLGQLQPPRWKRKMVTLLAGPAVILHPPSTAHVRMSRFRIAYCLMLRPLRRSLRAYGHYMLFPPEDKPRNVALGAAALLGRPLSGLARTIAAIWTSCRRGSTRTEILR